jgi:pimeloyl-ACP methyl ester carboxylesterase
MKPLLHRSQWQVWAPTFLLLFVACTKTQPNEGATDGKGTQPTEQAYYGCKVAPEDLRKRSGGYCRGPKKEKVIVFVNGIFGDAIDTWLNKTSYWPGMLALDPDFSDADIYVHSFDSPKIATAENIDELAGRMDDYFTKDGIFQKHKQVIFLCHSMGGLVTRAFLLKKRPSPNTVPMIYFFSTPTTGANIAGIASHLSDNPQLKYMLPIKQDGYVGDQQNAWLRTSDDPALNYPALIASFCAYEKLDTWGFRVVERQSATNLCNRETRAALRDHLSIVKPADTNQEPYVYFKAAYLHTFGPVATFVQTTIEAERERKSLLLNKTRKTTGQIGPETVTVRGIKTFREYKDVGCEEERAGDVTATYKLGENEHVLSVTPTIENIDNLSSSSAALVRFDDKSAVVRFKIRGLNKTLMGLNCPGGGHADIVVNVATVVGASK